MKLYELALCGAPTNVQSAAVEKCLTGVLNTFGLHLGSDVGWSIRPAAFEPDQKTSAAVAFFGECGVSDAGVDELLKRGIPIIPIATEPGKINAELPDRLKPFNCLTFAGDGPMRIATALLECLAQRSRSSQCSPPSIARRQGRDRLSDSRGANLDDSQRGCRFRIR